MSKIKNRRIQIKEKLSNQFNLNQKDINAAFAYAVFSLLPCETDDVLEQKESIETAIEIFNAIVNLEPGNWLARYYKVRLLSLFSDSFRDEQEILDELGCLVSMQENSKYEPYFILPYLLYAEIFFNNGDIDKAKEYIQKIEFMEKKPISLLKDFLFHQLVGFESKLKVYEEFEIAEKIKCQIYYT